MIDVKEAVAKARQHLVGMLSDEIPRDPRLEEVELSEDGSVWNITLSFISRGVPFSGTHFPDSSPREYKTIAIRSEDGRFLSMKIRQIA